MLLQAAAVAKRRHQQFFPVVIRIGSVYYVIHSPPEIRQRRHENRLPVLPGDIPGLLLLVFNEPLEPSASKERLPCPPETCAENSARYKSLFHPRINP